MEGKVGRKNLRSVGEIENSWRKGGMLWTYIYCTGTKQVLKGVVGGIIEVVGM